MATFKATKSVDEIVEATLLPEDWYLMRIVKEPKLMPNKKKTSDPSDPKARDNIVIDLRVVSDNPRFNGRPFRKYLPVPNKFDSENMNDFKGISYEDQFLADIVAWSVGFGHDVEGDEFEFDAGDEAIIYVKQAYDNRAENPTEEDLRNEISFASIPQRVE